MGMPNSVHKFSLLFSCGLLLIGGILVLFLEKGQMVIWLDQLHRPWLDQLVVGLTNLGNGIWVGVFCLVLCFFRYKYAIVLMLIGLLQLVLVAFLKQVVFWGAPRPLAYLEEGSLNNLVEGIRIHHLHSFPSGHTVTAFSLCFFFALLINRKSIAAILIFLAFLIGLSRVYLAQHFLVDVLAGATIGALLSGACYSLARHYSLFWQHPLLNHSLLRKRNLEYPTELT